MIEVFAGVIVYGLVKITQLDSSIFKFQNSNIYLCF